MIRKKRGRIAVIALLVLLTLPPLSFLIFSPDLPRANATGRTLNLKVLLIDTANDQYVRPYSLQTGKNMLRSYGIPFDVVVTSSIAASTFWDSASQINKYQFAVLLGADSIDDEGTYSTTVKNAITAAAKNGTNVIMLGASISQLGNTFFGYTSYAECPTHAQAGGTCSAETSDKVKINATFAGPIRGDPTFTPGAVVTGSRLAHLAFLAARPRAPGAGVKYFITYSTNGTTYPLAIFRKFGPSPAMVWWFGGIEGAFTGMLTGWGYMFQSNAAGNAGTMFRPVVDLFQYALNNVTVPNSPRMMAWGSAGSAQVVRIADHVSLTSVPCNNTGSSVLQQMIANNLPGELNFNLNGISSSILATARPTSPAGMTNPRGTAGFRYWGTLGGGATGSNNDYELVAVVNNNTATTDGGTGNSGSHSSTVKINDGNTTQIQKIEVLITANSAPSWTLAFRDAHGTTLWTSPSQTATLSTPTWVKFNDINFSGGSTGYVNNIQGADKLVLTVSSGAVKWENQSGTQANWVITGRSNWDIVYEDVGGSKNYASAVALVPDSIRMASGGLYPSQNKTAYFSSIPGEVHPADIVGETNTNAPFGVNFETFFTPADWNSRRGQLVIQSCKSAAQTYHWSIIPNGWTHAKTAEGSYDNDWYMGNGTKASTAFMIQRYSNIISYFDREFGTNVGTTTSTFTVPQWNAEWAFGTSMGSVSPALQELSNGGIFNALQDAEQLNGEQYGGYNRQSSIASACTSTTCTPYQGNIFTLPVRDGGKVAALTWDIGYNVTRESNSISETPADWNYVDSDYMLAKSHKLTQSYDIASTVWTTNYAAIKYWNATLNMMTHTTTFQWSSSSGTIALVTDTGTSYGVNSAKWGLPIVFRLPGSFQSLGFTSGSDNQTSGSITNSTANWRYYQVNVGSKHTTFTFTYTESTASVTVQTSPQLSNALVIDGVPYASPQTFAYGVNSVHNLIAKSPISCGVLCNYVFVSWSDAGAANHDVTIPSAITYTATYARIANIPVGVGWVLPVNITNTGSTTLPIGAQVKAVVSWSPYASYESADLRNIAVFDSAGTVYNAWNENGTSSAAHGVIWTKLKSALATSATLQLFVGFYSVGVNNYSPIGNWGEAPQLSGTYGTNDNGAKIFDLYQNFAGSSCPSGWSCGGSTTINNGATVAYSGNLVTTTRFGLNASQVLEINANLPIPTTGNTLLGYTDGTANLATHPVMGYDGNTAYSAANYVPTYSRVGQGVGQLSSPVAHGPHIWTVYWPDSSDGTWTIDYLKSVSVSGSLQVQDTALPIGVANNQNTNAAPVVSYMRLQYSSTTTTVLGILTPATSTIPSTSAPLALDGSGNVALTSGSRTASFQLTTSSPNDLIVVQDAIGAGGADCTGHDTISDSRGLVWHYRAHVFALTNQVEEWYAQAAAPLTLDTITVSFCASELGVVVGYGVSGANLAAPFDPNLSFPQVASNSGGSMALTVSTSSANTMLVGAMSNMGGQGIAAPSSFREIYNGVVSWSSKDFSYGILSSLVTNSAVTWGNGQGNGWLGLVDAVQGATSTTTTTTTTTSAPLALDGSGNVALTSGSRTASFQLTTSGPNDLIVVQDAVSAGGADCTGHDTISDSRGLVWHYRAHVFALTNQVEEWYAQAAAPLTLDTITVSFCASELGVVVGYGVSGANLAAPFDPNPSLPAQASGGNDPDSITISTTSPKTMVVGVMLNTGGQGITAPASTTDIYNAVIPWNSEDFAYQVVSSPLSNYAITWTNTQHNSWLGLVDAITSG